MKKTLRRKKGLRTPVLKKQLEQVETPVVSGRKSRKWQDEHSADYAIDALVETAKKAAKAAMKTRQRRQGTYPRIDRRPALLAALAETGNISLSCKICEMKPDTFYRYLHEDPEFAKAVERAKEIAADLLEADVYRRARFGVQEPVFYKGRVVGTVLRYSDGNAQFLLRGLRPEKYADRSKIEHSGSITLLEDALAELDEGVPGTPGTEGNEGPGEPGEGKPGGE